MRTSRPRPPAGTACSPQSSSRACGLPPVAAEASGVREALGPDPAGLLVPREDAEAFAAALLELLGDPEAARELGLRARRRVEEACSLERVGEQLRELLLR